MPVPAVHLLQDVQFSFYLKNAFEKCKCECLQLGSTLCALSLDKLYITEAFAQTPVAASLTQPLSDTVSMQCWQEPGSVQIQL